MMECNGYAIWLYGSHARGDADAQSDIDVLIISESVEDAINLSFLDARTENLSVTRYTWIEIARMADYGSLFLRHLRLEGVALVETPEAAGRLEEQLSLLGPYRYAERDTRGFMEVVQDVRTSLGCNASLVFELATLATVIRHGCILACALMGSPCFSRLGPVLRVSEKWPGALALLTGFESLYSYRLYVDGRVKSCALPSVASAAQWCARAETLLRMLRDRVDGSC